MLENIKAHSVVVARVAEFIVSELREAGADISVDLVVAAALLHDIGKTSCLNTNNNHALVGQDICLQHDLTEIGPLVAQHVILDSKTSFPSSAISAKEIVYYADKRVNHDQIVGLDERLDYIIERYGKGNSKIHLAIRKNFKRCYAIETELFASITCAPHDLDEAVQQFSSPWLSMAVSTVDELWHTESRV